MPEIRKAMTDIRIDEIVIDEWIDASSRDGKKLLPEAMTLICQINGIQVKNVKVDYNPPTEVKKIRQSIINVLQITE